jgi:hypothetical protein
MPKKKKLNSKNPKYWDKSQIIDRPIKERKLMCNAAIRSGSKTIVSDKKVPVYAVWYE